MLKKQIISFILVGALNTLVGYSLYALFIYLGFQYTVALLFATILGVLFNYKTIGKFVFNSKNNSSISKFILVYIIVFLINIIIIKIFREYGFNYYISGFLALFPCVITSFMLNKYYVFKDKNEAN